jgi:hypothetical protein
MTYLSFWPSVLVGFLSVSIGIVSLLAVGLFIATRGWRAPMMEGFVIGAVAVLPFAFAAMYWLTKDLG